MPISPIFQMFGQSPIRPLQTHMEEAYACVELLKPFFKAVAEQNWLQAKEIQQQITEREHKADELKKSFRLHMPKSLFLPVPRSDLLEMLAVQDRLPNQAKDIAGLVLGRQMKFPEIIEQPYMIFLERCLDAAKQAEHAIEELDELLESGFRGNEVKIVEDMITELDHIEHETDGMQIKIRQSLFDMEKSLPPVDVIFLYKIIEWTGSLADHAHDVGGQLYLLLAH